VLASACPVSRRAHQNLGLFSGVELPWVREQCGDPQSEGSWPGRWIGHACGCLPRIQMFPSEFRILPAVELPLVRDQRHASLGTAIIMPM
jgi:hypothetical protein